jgi:hypothetical protein
MTTTQLRIAELQKLIEANLNSPIDCWQERIQMKEELESLQS